MSKTKSDNTVLDNRFKLMTIFFFSIQEKRVDDKRTILISPRLFLTEETSKG